MTRTILVHLNVEADDADARDADAIAAYLEAALTVGLEGGPESGGLEVVVALAEEI